MPRARSRHVYTYMNAAEIAKLATICRKKGIQSIKVGPDYVEFKLAPTPQKPRRGKLPAAEPIADTPTYNADAALFWSSMGVGEEQPNG